MSVWRPSPIPSQLSAGVAALLATAGTAFIPQPYPAQLMGVAGARASALPIQARGFQPQLYPQPANPIVLLCPDAQAMAIAAARPAPLPAQLLRGYNPAFNGNPTNPPLAMLASSAATLFRAAPLPQQQSTLYQPAFDGPYQTPPPAAFVGVPAAARAPLPWQSPAFNAALLLAPANAPLPQVPYPYTALWATPRALPQGLTPYQVAFDGPFQAPPLVATQTLIARATAPPAQASGLNPALFQLAPANPPLQVLYPFSALWRAPTLPAQGANFVPSLFLPAQVDAPPLVQPYPYSALPRPIPMPAQIRSIFPAGAIVVIPDPPPLLPFPAYAALLRPPTMPVQTFAGYNPAFDGPFQAPPLGLVQAPVFARAGGIPQQAAFSIAPFLGVLSALPPSIPFQIAAYGRASGIPAQATPIPPGLYSSTIPPPNMLLAYPVFAGSRAHPDQGIRFNAALFLVPDAPPLSAVSGMPLAPFKPKILPVQAIPFNAAFLPVQVDAPPLLLPIPPLVYIHRLPRQAPPHNPAVFQPIVIVTPPSTLLAAADYFLIELRATDYFF